MVNPVVRPIAGRGFAQEDKFQKATLHADM